MATPLDTPSDSDDGFLDFLSDNDSDHETLLAQESAALERRMKTVGIRDGLELGKDFTLQEGFDIGFAQGAARTVQFGRLRGALETAAGCGLVDHTLMTQARACVSQLKAFERGSNVDNRASDDDAELAILTQAQDLLTSIGVDLSASSMYFGNQQVGPDCGLTKE
uniref:Essential protein Yae1 N-terminal domain-containing protein n=1 Tax=Peronospora matthiolae TaxID=2874970 RepID=A0AAV1U344_9STRA